MAILYHPPRTFAVDQFRAMNINHWQASQFADTTASILTIS